MDESIQETEELLRRNEVHAVVQEGTAQALPEDNNHETISENAADILPQQENIPAGEASESEGEETTVPLAGGSISPDELIEQRDGASSSHKDEVRIYDPTGFNTAHHLTVKSKLE